MKNKPIYYPNLNRGQWAALKLNEVKEDLPSTVVSDIGAGFGWFEEEVNKIGLVWQPFDYFKKIESTIIWDLNNPAPEGIQQAGYINILEVLEHLSNPELAIKHISDHLLPGGYIAITTPNPYFSKSKWTMLFKNRLYAFQPKHLVEHHVNIPLPHIVQFFLEKNGFELLEYGVLGKNHFPKFRFSINFVKDTLKYGMECFLAFNIVSKGDTQLFFARKTKIS